MASILTLPFSAMLLRTLPDFASAHPDTRHSFNAKWGRENFIIWGRARRAKFGPCAHGLSIRAAWMLAAEVTEVANRLRRAADPAYASRIGL